MIKVTINAKIKDEIHVSDMPEGSIGIITKHPCCSYIGKIVYMNELYLFSMDGYWWATTTLSRSTDFMVRLFEKGESVTLTQI